MASAGIRLFSFFWGAAKCFIAFTCTMMHLQKGFS